MTFYFIIHEAEMTPANDNAVAGPAVAGSAGAPDAGVDSTEVTLAAAGPGGDLVPLNDQHCRPLAHVTRAFADQVQLQGTGKLRDGRLVNVATRCQCGRPCFHIVAASKEWGTGGKRQAAVAVSLGRGRFRRSCPWAPRSTSRPSMACACPGRAGSAASSTTAA
jgi:hypothetical protein